MDINFNEKQYKALETDANEILFGGSRQGGKASSLNTYVITNYGWKQMKDIHPGEYVFDENGQPTLVVAESPIDYDSDTYKVTFDDGHFEIVDGRHSWYTQTKAERQSNLRRTPEARAKRRANRKSNSKYPDRDNRGIAEANSAREHEYDDSIHGDVRETVEILETLKVNGSKGTLESNHAIPCPKPLQFPEAKDLIIDPYIFGLWMGDGCTSSGKYACNVNDTELIDAIRDAGYDINPVLNNKVSWYVKKMVTQLKELKVYGDKHVPNRYKFSSYEQRLAFVQGIMDSDGYIRPSGSCEISLSCPRLAKDVNYMIRSLGIKCSFNQREAKLYGVRKKDRYRMKFTTELPIFRLKRKKDLLPKKALSSTKFWFITNVEKIDPQPKKCIQVANESHQYLIGEHFVPTHNSFLIRYAAMLYALYVPGIQIYLFRRKYNDLIKNHMKGPHSFPNILKPYIEAKICAINMSSYEISFKNGSSIFLVHCQHEKDVENYRGVEMHVLLIDEATHFPRYVIDFLRTNVRLGSFKLDYPEIQKSLPFVKEGYFPRIYYATNPGGPSHNYFRKNFVKYGPEGKVYKADILQGGMKRVFIRSRVYVR